MFGLLWSDVESCRKWKIKVDWERQSVSKCQSMCKNCLKAISSMKGRLPKDIFLKIPKYFTPFLIWHPWQYTWKNIMHYALWYNLQLKEDPGPAYACCPRNYAFPGGQVFFPGRFKRLKESFGGHLLDALERNTWDWKITHLHKVLKWPYLHINVWLWFSINYIAL